jgi:Fic family protein
MNDKYFSYKFLKNGMLPVEIASLLYQVAEKIGKVNGASIPFRYIDATTKSATFDSVKFSNEIEGIKTSNKNLNSLLYKEGKPKNHSEQEILGYFEIFKEITNNYKTMDISVNSIKHIHKVLEQFNDSYLDKGEFKTEDNAIVGYRDGHQYIIFKPVSAKETSKNMDLLCETFKIAYSDSDISPLLLIPCFILDFLCIHPFDDGNGRTSRLITNLLLLKSNHKVILNYSLDKYIFLNIQYYYFSIAESNKGWHDNSNNYFPFITFFLKMLLLCYQESEDHINGFKTLKNEKRKLILQYFEDSQRPVSKSELISKLYQLSISLIQKELNSLLNEGIIVKTGNYRNSRYILSNQQNNKH